MATVIPSLSRDRWAQRRKRAEVLAESWPFAADVLALYMRLLDAQEAAYERTREDAPQAQAVPAYCAERVVPRIVEVSVADGPALLVEGVLQCFDELDFEETIAKWLRGEELPAIERFLARASSAPVLEALGAAAGDACEGPRDDRHCPTCGGVPQLSFFAPAPEDLVTAHRYLECARCGTSWPYTRMKCAFCGESESAKLQVYSEVGTLEAEAAGRVMKGGAPEGARFPHIRVDACLSCSRYLLNVDLSRDGRAVPIVDELAAIPLDIYAKERGLRKVLPNLMGC
ncbi:MAG: hypothetical protein ACXWNJ_18010 [Vulcanimicrobiaceae bacterium]